MGVSGVFIVAALVGVGVGLLSGLLGIGGGTIMVPLYRLAFGLSPVAAAATSLFTIIPTSLAGLGKHVRNKTIIPKLGVAAGVVGAVFSPVGVWAASKSPGWLIMAAAAAVIIYSSTTMFRKAFQKMREDKSAQVEQRDDSLVPDGAVEDEAVEQGKRPPVPADADDEFTFTPKRIAFILLIGAIAGFTGGYVGVGGGFIMVPMFVSVLGIPMRKASGSSLVAICILAVPGVVTQAMMGNVHFAIGIAMALGSMPGSWLGASLVKRIPEAMLRLIFAVFLIIVAIILVVNEFVFAG